MRVGIIGLGNIAQKAYLPVITQLENIDPYFCTRNENTLEKLGKKYRVKKLYNSMDKLLATDIDAAFVHAATQAHYELVKRLLDNKIATFVDKPISYHLKKTEELVEKAKTNNTILMTGFNRRYAPTYKSLLKINEPKTIIMQKNRVDMPGKTRKFILDDFIHVIDTLLYLLGDVEFNSIDFDKIKRKENLVQIILKLKHEKNTAIGIMNRDNAVTEETIEVMGLKEKRKIKNLTQIKKYDEQGETLSQTAGWNRMEYNRGFVDMIAEFLRRVKKEDLNLKDLNKDLLSHHLAEKIVVG